MADISFKDVCERFGIEKLSETQEKALRALHKGKDVFVSIKTGGGKSLCYQAFPLIKTKDARVLVISPLISIMEEQCRFLNDVGLSASYIGRNKEEDERIHNGDIMFVFSSPESLLSIERWRTWLHSTTIDLLVVDEAHTVILWSEGGMVEPFRKWFGNIGEARCLLSCPILVITATASRSKRLKLHKKLALIDCVNITDSPDRDNVKLSTKFVKTTSRLDDIFDGLLTELIDKQEACEIYLLFTTIRMCGTLYSMFRRILPEGLMKHIEMFHSLTPDPIKERIREDMGKVDGTIRILIASSSAGMGVNFKGIHNIVHYGPPKDMDSFVQQIGRAGRDGLQSFQVLLFNGQHTRILRKDKKIHEMLKYVTNKES